MRLKIKPLESFLFKNAKPFNVGDTIAEGIFPFLPSTLYGAIRTAVIAQQQKYDEFLKENDPELLKQIGTRSIFGNFSLKSQFLSDGTNNYFITPRDLCYDKLSRENRLFSQVRIESDFITDEKIGQLGLYRPKTSDMRYPEESWLVNLKPYLLGCQPELAFKSKGDFFEIEEKVGISIEKKTGTAKEQMLFTQRRYRMKEEYFILVDLDGLTLLANEGVLTLGQDRRLFHYDFIQTTPILTDDEKSTIISGIKKSRKFKIYFASPSVFDQGWLPASVSRGDYTWNISKHLKVRITSVFLGRPTVLGGWNLALDRPKIMHRGIPAGSVYYCEIIEGDEKEIFDYFYDRSISDFSNECYDKQGFGHIFITNLYE